MRIEPDLSIDMDHLLSIPLYRDLYADLGEHPSRVTSLAQLPMLDKSKLVHAFPGCWMTKDLEDAIGVESVEYTTTSGSSGERMQIVRPKQWWKGEYQRTYRTTALLKEFDSGADHKCILTTAVCSSAVCWRTDPTFEERIVGNTLYLNTSADPNEWREQDVQRIFAEIDNWQPLYLDADPQYLALLITKARAMGVPAPAHTPSVVSLSYEYASQFSVDIIRSFFSSRICNLYGSTEAGYLMIDEGAGYRRTGSGAHLEFVPVQGMGSGVCEIVVTSIKNECMPLVRYRTGDLVKMAEEGRIEAFCGRAKDAVEGCRGWVTVQSLDDALHASGAELHAYQLEASTNAFRLRYVAGQAFSSTDEAALRQALTQMFGSQKQLQLKRVEEIHPLQSGKFALCVPAKASPAVINAMTV